jgi:hypothetical protein
MPPVMRIGPNADGRMFFTSSTGMAEAKERAKTHPLHVPSWALNSRAADGGGGASSGGGSAGGRRGGGGSAGSSEAGSLDPYTTPTAGVMGVLDVAEGAEVEGLEAGDPLEEKLRALEAAVSRANSPQPQEPLEPPQPPQPRIESVRHSHQSDDSGGSNSGSASSTDTAAGNLSAGVILCPSGAYAMTLADPSLYFALASKALTGGGVVDATVGLCTLNQVDP